MGHCAGELVITTAAPFFARPGEVNRERALIHGFSVEQADGFFRLSRTAHHHKGEALRSPRVSVLDDIHRSYCARLSEHCPQLFLGRVVGHIPNIKFCFQFSYPFACADYG